MCNNEPSSFYETPETKISLDVHFTTLCFRNSCVQWGYDNLNEKQDYIQLEGNFNHLAIVQNWSACIKFTYQTTTTQENKEGFNVRYLYCILATQNKRECQNDYTSAGVNNE